MLYKIVDVGLWNITINDLWHIIPKYLIVLKVEFLVLDLLKRHIFDENDILLKIFNTFY